MNRVKHCLNKMNELVNKPGKTEIIDLDLLLDYTKIIYAEVLEHRQMLVSNHLAKESVLRYKEDNGRTENNTDNVSAPPKTPEKQKPAENHKIPKPENLSQNTPEELVSVGINFENPSEKSKKIDIELTDLRRLIPLNDKFAYVIELFNEDNEKYEDAINHLNSLETYGNTMDWVISNLQNRYNWDVENDLVVKFYEAIKSRFDKKA